MFDAGRRYRFKDHSGSMRFFGEWAAIDEAWPPAARDRGGPNRFSVVSIRPPVVVATWISAGVQPQLTMSTRVEGEPVGAILIENGSWRRVGLSASQRLHLSQGFIEIVPRGVHAPPSSEPQFDVFYRAYSE